MSVDFSALSAQSRLLMEAALQPIQGSRFQPTGFPDLGAAVYEAPDCNGNLIQMLMVESAQSMANRLEATCWNEATGRVHDTIDGIPYVSVDIQNSEGSSIATTNSLLEAHRLNSPYIMRDAAFGAEFRRSAKLSDDGKAGVFRRAALAQAAFRYDPGSVLHGVFLEKLDGRARLQRCLSGCIEAHGIYRADSGGVKNDRIAPSPKMLEGIVSGKVDAAQGFGNVPFHRAEFTAQQITAYFSLDLAQLRAYGLGESGERFLIVLALWKVRKFLEEGLRLRTACDLDLAGDLQVTRPKDTCSIPNATELGEQLPPLIAACRSEGLFVDPPITQLTFPGKN